MNNNNDYQYIRANCKYWGSFRYYLEDELKKARSTNAPPDAVFRRKNGTWCTYRDLCPQMKEELDNELER